MFQYIYNFILFIIQHNEITKKELYNELSQYIESNGGRRSHLVNIKNEFHALFPKYKSKAKADRIANFYDSMKGVKLIVYYVSMHWLLVNHSF